ncbi:asparagine synthase (glutamine-hydrolyzing) [Chryseobacterium oranimense]|uniref:asparagine synthase (glutamine-hydrolyzing) n=1 Tax=Chryseobacterium oranimense TaxID=421058 RepID=UPI0021B03D0B|nr:asparagine synthase (glutamine-hydrolyzing) [Chryseobacterium oranimense]UWX60789.1 asparagine synthase (glutamine-hydrolyzing) [Chryseobacterium oranimense]
MCGIAGLIYKNSTTVLEESLKKMTDKMSHRGPDAEGFFVYQSLGLGHRRLSIIDVSESANQPFFLEDKLVLVFNGAIYNYIEIREELKQNGYSFKTTSDTEVLINSYDFWGEECVNKFNGMWSFAIYDKKANKLFCSRDRFGVKPFYYYSDKDQFIFASEIKPILEIQKIENVNLQVLLQYLIINISDQTNETFFENILKLPGSHNLVYDLNTNEFNIYKYYDIKFKEEINKLNLQESIDVFEKEFENSVKIRLRSDVKIGSALSGGTDSSYMVSVASKFLSESDQIEKFTAVTVGSVDEKTDESGMASLTTQVLNINHDIIMPKEDEFKDTFEEVIFKHEEPFGGIAVYMQKFLMKETNSLGIKVLLDGQGADEILLGYNRYTAAYLRNHGIVSNIKFLSHVKSHYDISILQGLKIYYYFSNFFVRKLWLKKRGQILKDKYFNTIDFSSTKRLTKSYKKIFELQKNEIFWCQLPELLKWEDKNSMSYSVETRLPYLDYNFVETCLSINNHYKIRNGWSKYLLRKNLEKYLPDQITYNRRKIGFDAPVDHWWPRSEKILEIINDSKIIQQISKKKFTFIADRDLEWRLYNIAVWERLYNMKIK